MYVDDFRWVIDETLRQANEAMQRLKESVDNAMDVLGEDDSL